MVDIRQAEQIRAQQNPNIQTGLVGAPTQTSRMQAPPVGGVPQGLVPSSVPGAQQAGQMAQELSSKLYGSGFVSGGEAQKDYALAELARTDQRLENAYQGKSALPTPSWYVPNPADEVKALQPYARGMGQVAGQSIGAVSTAEREYQTAISSTLDKFLNFMQLEDQRKRYEQDREDKEKRDRMEFEMAMGQITGQPFSVTNPWTGETKTVTPKGPTPTEGERESVRLREQMTTDVQRGINLGDLMSKYKDVVDFNEILGAYRESPYGAPEETMETLRGMYKTGAGVGKEDVVTANQLRDEYMAQSKDFRETRNAYNRLLSADETPAGDMSLIFSYMKMLDPGSTVREGEYATAEKTAGIPTRIRQSYNRVLAGEKLAPEQRQDFRNQSSNLYKNAEKQHGTLIDEYSRLAQQLGLDPSLVIVDISQVSGLEGTGDPAEKLRSAGYSEEQIAEYLQSKGLAPSPGPTPGVQTPPVEGQDFLQKILGYFK